MWRESRAFSWACAHVSSAGASRPEFLPGPAASPPAPPSPLSALRFLLRVAPRVTLSFLPAPPPPELRSVRSVSPRARPRLPDQERAELAAGRRHLEARQALYAKLQMQLDNCPESVREQLQEQLRRVSFTSPLPGPEATCPGERRAWDRTTWALQYLPGRQGRCFGLEGQGGLGDLFFLSAAAGGGACERGKASRGKGLDGGRSLPQLPWSSPQNSHLCGLAFQAQSGIFEHHPTPFVTVFQGGRGPGD